MYNSSNLVHMTEAQLTPFVAHVRIVEDLTHADFRYYNAIERMDKEAKSMGINPHNDLTFSDIGKLCTSGEWLRARQDAAKALTQVKSLHDVHVLVIRDMENIVVNNNSRVSVADIWAKQDEGGDPRVANYMREVENAVLKQ